ncbi:zinc finger and BTB domain-containing protein 17-like isoform X2 [Amphibalanus amphitrite]|uniref:zinc finger and BTB domain-containing protein 17-like isoform X2 n=1 Tax=Amphibalanus amphitrite TaxID=1232801 RepID=UPI001C916F1A|nr:zinc finger and BTB domain-containing protein 17-like isoform X2 [Amphibalanus amphitrite]XP_043232993.1 zinc finger and BTB domain-containing protein 17-like isoform X2 [Amphibalanus amphitrite]XP_043233000.1 zinc finger and BTB domain-containing protein 17-like isoform X2 [Amphibalanus amphitrite]XP_043233009.1 zinc finger and BTB domain-containing protein 17-like isoform X2 [Amphibalanus amphitrite]XP_043233016.1 zinc finger and BTB domain-containing protein 17-like isoform X2 [Amphibalan
MMTKWNKKPKFHIKTPTYRTGDHGYGQFNRSLHRYNAVLGCFEEVLPAGMSYGAEPTHEGAAPKKPRMKVMIKPFTNEAGEVVAVTPALPAPLPAPLPAQQRVERYEEVVEDSGEVVVHVPDSAAGPDGVIRLLQVTNEDGSVSYISADHAEMDADFSMEDAMQMILTEVDADSRDGQSAVVHDIHAQHAADDVEQEALAAPKDEPGDPDTELLELSSACYVCGQRAADGGSMTPLMTGRSRHTDAPLAELLADTVQRELTVSSADGVCAACLCLLDSCDLPDGPLKKSASRHVRNVLAVRVGDLASVDGGPWARKRKRPRQPRDEDDQWMDPGAAGDTDWTPGMEMKGQRRGPRKSRDARPWSPTPEEPRLEHLTDLTMPSENKRSARIAIRKNAFVASAVHASNRPRVLVDPELQSKYLADPPPQRRPYRRLNPNPLKGRRGRPKLPNPPENEPMNVVTVDSEATEKPPDVELVTAAAAEPPQSPVEPAGAASLPARDDQQSILTEPGETTGASRGGEDDPVLADESADGKGDDHALSPTKQETEKGETTDGEREDPTGEQSEPEQIYVDLHELQETEEETEMEGEDAEETMGDGDEEWKPTPGCTCVMCTELTDVERAILDAEGFNTTYVCQVCGDELVGRDRYRRHEYSCRHRRKKRRRPPIVHECNTCHLVFKSARLRDEHYERSGHEKRSPCPVCHKFFHPDFLRIHLSSHSGAFYCRVCDTHFSSKATLKGHMNIHSGTKPHRCDVCPAAFRTPSTLFMHKRYHHSDDRPYECNFCPKRFAARSTLRIHLRQHTGERPFACKLCPKSYTRKSSLTQHLRSHTQERRHACMTCGKRFDNKTYLKVHMNRHLGIRAHACGRCGRSFFSRPNLLKHMQVLCYKEDYGKPAEEQERRTRELRAAAEQQLAQAGQQAAVDGDQAGLDDQGQLQMADMDDDDDIQTTEVILAIESIPENGELLVGHMVQ